MKIKYEAPKGRRIKRYGFCGLEHENKDYWYVRDIRQWRTYEDILKNVQCFSSFAHCKSLKSAIRQIRKYDCPKGTKFRLASKWVGYDIDITK